MQKAKKMRFIVSPFTDPAINLALEEVYFNIKTDEFCFLYRNAPSVIIGKHQNIFREANLLYCIKNNVAFHRRLSGGGTVFHDLGNLNISLHSNRHDEYKVNYGPLLDLIKDTASKFGISLIEGKRNDLYLKEFKVTGTACHVVRDRTVHHGTLLYNTDKTLLHQCLEQSIKIEGRGVESVRSSVTNISDHLTKKMDTEEFMSEFIVFASEGLGCYIDYPTDEEVNRAMELKEEKYKTDQWNIDYSPPFKAEVTIRGIKYFINVLQGKITSIDEGSEKALQQWTGDSFKNFILQNQ